VSVVDVEERGLVTIVAIDRPKKLNSINKAVAVELQQAFAAFDRSARRVAILTGRGRAFSAGADVTDLPELWRCVPTAAMSMRMDRIDSGLDRLERRRDFVPTVPE
jgi:enoyl-CoA hydratase